MIAGTDHRARPWHGVHTPRGCPASGWLPPPPGARSPPARSFSRGTRGAAAAAPRPQEQAQPAGAAPRAQHGAGQSYAEHVQGAGLRGARRCPAEQGMLSPPPSGGEDGARISEGNKRRGTKERGRTPVAPLGDEPRCFYSLPSVGGTAAANCQQRQVTAQSRPRPGARRGSGGRGRAGWGGVPAASPRPGRHRGAGPRRRCPRAVLPGGDRRAPAPPKQLKINK